MSFKSLSTVHPGFAGTGTAEYSKSSALFQTSPLQLVPSIGSNLAVSQSGQNPTENDFKNPCLNIRKMSWAKSLVSKTILDTKPFSSSSMPTAFAIGGID